MIRHLIIITLLSVSLVACENNPEKGKYHMDGSISEEVLNNYLSRAITMGEFCLPNSDAEFEEFGLPVQIRNFSFGAMIYTDGMYNDR